ncbi:hypothetical protein ES702_07161 [subsurface metagenome]
MKCDHCSDKAEFIIIPLDKVKTGTRALCPFCFIEMCKIVMEET